MPSQDVVPSVVRSCRNVVVFRESVEHAARDGGRHGCDAVRGRAHVRISGRAHGKGRTPAPILASLAQPRIEVEAPSSWFVGRVPVSKRALDLLLIGLALPALVPLFILVSLYIKIVSPGPVFFTQERVGFRERRFRIFKFRSMKVNAEVQSHQDHTTMLYKSGKPMEKMDHVDKRLIPFSWILRSTGLDEIPQLINVLRGEMSIVGPRPCTIYEHEVMLPWHRRRFDVLPGLTGLWQVSGKNRTTFQQMINFDIIYARNRSVLVDVQIMARTFPVLISQVKEMIEKKRRAKQDVVMAGQAGVV